jgi:hypothetical protein
LVANAIFLLAENKIVAVAFILSIVIFQGKD